jgi:uncharacterized protein (DUF1501 family)
MKRRDFLKSSLPMLGAPIVWQGQTIQTLAQATLQKLLGSSTQNDRVLVLIQLNGGNDGLNTVIPLEYYSNLAKLRSNVLIPENRVIALDTKTGLHPAMSHIRELFLEKKVGVLHSVGYPNPNLSHFRSTDIWTSASDSDQVITTGWLGRYLAELHPNFPQGYPSDQNTDPLAITIGAVVSQTCQGPVANMGLAITSTESFYQILSGQTEPTPDTNAGRELEFIRKTMLQTTDYLSTVKLAASKAKNLSNRYPAQGQNPLADQLKIVANLIAGGLKTKIYVVSIGGFDTHANQVAQDNTLTGTHNNLLGSLSQAVDAFQHDLSLLKIEDRVLAMTFSEFGRRIRSNSTYGTDHGHAAPLFLFGSKVNPILHGTNPVIDSMVGIEDSVDMQFDFRSVYASVFKQWFELDDLQISSVMGETFPYMPLILDGATGFDSREPIGFLQNYPNPFRESTRIRFAATEPGFVQIKIYDAEGSLISTLFDEFVLEGEKEIKLSGDSLPIGIYHARLKFNDKVYVRKLIRN